MSPVQSVRLGGLTNLNWTGYENVFPDMSLTSIRGIKLRIDGERGNARRPRDET